MTKEFEQNKSFEEILEVTKNLYSKLSELPIGKFPKEINALIFSFLPNLKGFKIHLEDKRYLVNHDFKKFLIANIPKTKIACELKKVLIENFFTEDAKDKYKYVFFDIQEFLLGYRYLIEKLLNKYFRVGIADTKYQNYTEDMSAYERVFLDMKEDLLSEKIL